MNFILVMLLEGSNSLNFYLACLQMLMQENKFWKFLGLMWNPLSWVMEAAAIVAIVLANSGVSRNYNIMGITFYLPKLRLSYNFKK